MRHDARRPALGTNAELGAATVNWLTKPTRARLTLWLVLALLWFLLLPQHLAMDPHSTVRVSVPGTVFWVVVLSWMLTCAWITWRRYRRGRGRRTRPRGSGSL